MKKIFFTSLIISFLGICNLNAQTKYSVTVTVKITKVYYNDADYIDEAFQTTSTGTPQKIPVCASTPEEAKSEAKNECSTLCRRDSGRKMGKETVNGKTYYVKEYREVYDASATVIGTC